MQQHPLEKLMDRVVVLGGITCLLGENHVVVRHMSALAEKLFSCRWEAEWGEVSLNKRSQSRYFLPKPSDFALEPFGHWESPILPMRVVPGYPAKLQIIHFGERLFDIYLSAFHCFSNPCLYCCA